ncbi:MAG: pitrilysin family protein [Candidatus Gastranaerophilales bacterium]|nr:pitrilysin family protein [Candidatus Gastranaerophilales bacterium]
MKKIFITFIVLFFGLAGFAADYNTYKLENGQTVIIKEVHDNPMVIIDTWINTGSVNETDKNTGVAHFLEHLFFKGTLKHPAKDFDRILESKGAITNAATSKDFTHYYILIPSKYFNLAMDLHSDMLLNPLIPRKELEKERKVVLEEISKNNDNPTTVMYNKMNDAMYKIHPYKREVIGTRNVIETIPREDIMEFYNKWYVPSNMTTVIVGDVDSEKALNSVKKYFVKEGNVAQKAPKAIYKMDKKPSRPVEITTPFKVETAYMVLGFKGCQNAKSKDSYSLDLLATILGDGKTSRLYKTLKEQKQLVYSIGSGHSSYKQDSTFYVTANFAPENADKIKDSTLAEINKIKLKGVDEEELEKAKKIVERDTYYSRESISNIANEIGYTMILTGDSDYYANYLNNMKKVTVQDVQNAAKQYLDTNSMVESVIMPENVKLADKKDSTKKDYSAKVISQNGNIIKYELQNGADLIINHNKSNDIVAMDISVKGGNFTEKIKGLGTVTADAMLKGTQKYTTQELALMLEETGVRIVPQAKADTFSIGVKYTANERDTAFDLLNEVLNNANLDAYDIEKVKKDKMDNIKKTRDNPTSVVFEEFKTAMWDGTAYGNSGKVLEKTIPSIKQNDVKVFYDGLFSPKNIVISVNGNVDDKTLINYFSQLFSTKQNAHKVVLANYSSQFTPKNQNLLVKTPKDTQTAWIVIGWRVNGVLNKKDWATLQVIDSLLGGGMSSRLFTELRDQEGLAYQVGSTYAPNFNKGAFAVYIGTNPKTAIVARDGLMSEITKLKKEFVGDKELTQAKDKLLGNYVLSLETNMDKASTIGWFEVSDRGYMFMNEFPKLIESVTVQDIISTANKYFSEPYVMSVVGPKAVVDKF